MNTAASTINGTLIYMYCAICYCTQQIETVRGTFISGSRHCTYNVQHVLYTYIICKKEDKHMNIIQFWTLTMINAYVQCMCMNTRVDVVQYKRLSTTVTCTVHSTYRSIVPRLVNFKSTA